MTTAEPVLDPAVTETFDVRTRTMEQIGHVDPVRFYEEEVPRHLAERGELATRAFRQSGLESIVVSVGDDVRTWQLGADGDLEIVAGDHGRARADLDLEWFGDIIDDVRSTVALMIANLPVMARGHIFHLISWEPVLRALIDGRPAYEPGLVDFVDRDGSPLDLGRTFAPDEDPADLRHFLSQAGFLHVRGVYTEGEMAELSTEIDRWRALMEPSDDRAWWATVEGSDEQIVVRVSEMGPDIDFGWKDRLEPIVAVTGADHRYAGSAMLVKPVGVVQGISDLPWHKDCAIGGHSLRCMNLTCGIAVTEATPDNGQLGVMAGSHRVNIPLLEVNGAVDLPRIHPTTAPGDVTVHVSCVLHCATPPVHSERRVTYSSFRLPGDRGELDKKTRAVRTQAARDTFAPS